MCHNHNKEEHTIYTAKTNKYCTAFQLNFVGSLEMNNMWSYTLIVIKNQLSNQTNWSTVTAVISWYILCCITFNTSIKPPCLASYPLNSMKQIMDSFMPVNPGNTKYCMSFSDTELMNFETLCHIFKIKKHYTPLKQTYE